MKTQETCVQQASEPTTAEIDSQRSTPLLVAPDAVTEERWLFERIKSLLHPSNRNYPTFGGVIALKIISQHGPALMGFDYGFGYLLATVEQGYSGEYVMRMVAANSYVLGEARFFTRKELYG